LGYLEQLFLLQRLAQLSSSHPHTQVFVEAKGAFCLMTRLLKSFNKTHISDGNNVTKTQIAVLWWIMSVIAQAATVIHQFQTMDARRHGWMFCRGMRGPMAMPSLSSRQAAQAKMFSAR
jgi:hypothetical protein